MSEKKSPQKPSLVLDNLKREINVKTDAELARKLGVTFAMLSHHRGRGTAPYKKIIEYCTDNRIPIERVFVAGAGERTVLMESPFSSEKEGYAVFPTWTGKNLREGSDKPARGLLALNSAWVESGLNAEPENLRSYEVDDEGMSPTLQPGDVVLVDTADAKMSRSGIYMFMLEDSVMLRRLQRVGVGTIRATSDNPAIESFTLPKLGENVKLLGRVVWVGKRL